MNYYQIKMQKFLNDLPTESMAIIFSGKPVFFSADEYYPFCVNRNFLYLTGLSEENYILVLLNGKVKKEILLFANVVSPEIAAWIGESLSFENIAKITGLSISQIKDKKDFDGFMQTIFENSRRNIYGNIERIYLDFYKITPEADNLESHKFYDKYHKSFPYIKFENCYKQLQKYRSIKDTNDIALIGEALKITDEAIKAVYANAKTGMMEYNVESYYNFVLKNYNTKTSFPTICAGGENATVLHYVSNDSKINDNDLVLLDLGVYYKGLCSDISRVFPISGKFSLRQKEVYQAVLDCNKKMIELVKPGMTFGEFNQIALNFLSKKIVELGISKDGLDIKKYYWHTLGHQLGYDVHDVCDYETPILEGMVLTIEPGLYIKDEKIGIRIEDDVLITADGCINLSKDLIKEVSDIEDYMKKNNSNCK